MTDLTAAQIVSMLRRIDYSLAGHAATLIEQQAEQIAGLERTAHVNYGLYKSATEDLDKAESEVAALRKANNQLGFDLREVWRANMALRKVIEDAPHGYGCTKWDTAPVTPCNCWKSKALADEETL